MSPSVRDGFSDYRIHVVLSHSLRAIRRQTEKKVTRVMRAMRFQRARETSVLGPRDLRRRRSDQHESRFGHASYHALPETNAKKTTTSFVHAIPIPITPSPEIKRLEHEQSTVVRWSSHRHLATSTRQRFSWHRQLYSCHSQRGGARMYACPTFHFVSVTIADCVASSLATALDAPRE